MCTTRNAGMVTAGIVTACAAKNLHFLFTSTVTERSGCLPGERHVAFLNDVWPWIDATFYSFLPFSLLLVFNALIIHRHRLALRRGRSLRATASVGGAGAGATRGGAVSGQWGGGARAANFSQRLTTMLLVVSFTFMALTAPKVILIIVRKEVFVFFPSPGRIDFAVVSFFANGEGAS